ncbi:MAG: hypothetical protein PHD48_01725 [Alphaproteobacteria bacterium]|nr:hypothetical protein [Alphaproteobacteria bacterium]
MSFTTRIIKTPPGQTPLPQGVTRTHGQKRGAVRDDGGGRDATPESRGILRQAVREDTPAERPVRRERIEPRPKHEQLTDEEDLRFG